MVSLSSALNFSTNIGHDSPKRLACEIKRPANAARTRKVSNKVIAIAIILFIPIRVKKFTTGWSTIARMVAKTIGTMMLLPMYINVKKANKPIRKRVAFAYNGNLSSSPFTTVQDSFPYGGKYVEKQIGQMI